MFKKVLTLVFILAILVMAAPVSAATSTINYLRAYNNGSIYIVLDSIIACNTTVFVIDASHAGSDEMYSAALSALMGNKKISVEPLVSTGCTGWGTKVQSLYLHSD